MEGIPPPPPSTLLLVTRPAINSPAPYVVDPIDNPCQSEITEKGQDRRAQFWEKSITEITAGSWSVSADWDTSSELLELIRECPDCNESIPERTNLFEA